MAGENACNDKSHTMHINTKMGLETGVDTDAQAGYIRSGQRI